MELILNQTYHGFSVKEVTYVADIHSQCYLLEHEKSGAKLLYAKNDDTNKVFFVSFKTPPLDHCGTAHILEHSVLCGSKKYPAKDPFNELMKGSLNTYLNALTYSDKTMYPVASCNQEDFKNLSNVYLDAVFAPAVLKEEKIFKQEGWAYQLKTLEEPITINGVVYNEMKGATASPDRVLNSAINRSLFSESVYKYESGGEPEAIVELTYENFISFYNKYYQPSNSFFYLYGDLDIEERLAYINSQYLASYEKQGNKVEIKEEPKHSHRGFVSDTFSIPQGTRTGNESMLSLNFITGKSTNTLLALSMEILSYILLETGGSPLKKAIVEKKIAESVEGWFDSSTYDMVFSIIAKNSSCKKIALFKETIYRTLEKIVEEGLDKELVLSAINYHEFFLREGDFGHRPKGLFYGMNMMKGWLHGQSPMEALKVLEHLETMRENINKGYFENLIKEYLLNSTNSSIAAIAGEEGKQEKAEAEMVAKLGALKNEMSKIQLEDLIKETNNLKEYQDKEDSKEDIEKVPVLSIENIKKDADFNAYSQHGAVIQLPLETKGISYVRLMFSLEGVEKDLVPYAAILAKVLGKLDTALYSFDRLPTEINMYAGGISASATTFSTKDGFKPVLILKGKALHRNKDKLFHLIEEILLNTDLSNICGLRKILMDLKADYQRHFDNNGHIVAVKVCEAMLSPEGLYSQLLSGIEFNDTLLNALENLEETKEKLMVVAKTVFNKENLVTIISSEEKYLEGLEKDIAQIEVKLGNSQISARKFKDFNSFSSQAIETSQKIVYNAKASNFLEKGIAYSGKMNVIKNIINTEFLWNMVRVKGGAYGCGCNFTRSGNVYFYSYRDPNIAETFTSFGEVPAFLESINLTQRDLTKYTLGAVNSIDKPKGNTEKIEAAIARHFLGLTKEDLEKSRQEMLSVSTADVKAFAQIVEKAMENSVIATFGSETKIKENASLYQTIRQLKNSNKGE